MRLISTDPEFSLGGTAFIVIGFTVFGLGQGFCLRSRLSGIRYRRVVGRVLGVLSMIPLGMGAGALMFPSLVVGGIALNNPRTNRMLRLTLAVVALVPATLVAWDIRADFGMTLRGGVGAVGLFGLYLMTARVARPSLQFGSLGRGSGETKVVT